MKRMFLLVSMSIIVELSRCAILRGRLFELGTTTTTTTVKPKFETDSLDEVTTPCRIPSFIKILPVHFRRQLRKIWSGLPSADSDCSKQLLETRQLVDSLPIGLKLKIAEFGEENDRFRSNFFSELLPEEKMEFGDILKNMSLNATEKAQLLRDWASSKLSVPAMENLEKYLHSFIERDRKFQEKVANLSDEAKDAYKRIQAIRREKQHIFSHLSEKAKKELMILFKSACETPMKPGTEFHHVKVRNVDAEEPSPIDAAILSNEPFSADPLEQELLCFGLMIRSPLRHILRQKFASLTQSYNSIMQPTPASTVEQTTTNDPATQLLKLLLQRVPAYFKP